MALWHTPEVSNLWQKVKLGLTWSTCDQAILLPLCLGEEKKTLVTGLVSLDSDS